jgi:hypothetical protein
MRFATLALLCLVVPALAFSGCAGGPAGKAGTPSSATTNATSTGKVPTANRTAAPLAAPPHAVTLYLTADGHLSAVKPAEGQVTATMLPTALLTGAQTVEFLGEPATAPGLIAAKTVAVTLWVQADAPMPSNGEFDAGIWLGTTRGDTLSKYAVFPAPAVAPGTVQRLDMQLEFGTQLPIPIPKGESVKALVGVTGDYGAGTSRILVGGDHASSVNLTLEGLAGDPFAATPVNESRLTGELTGATPGMCGGTPVVSALQQPIHVQANASFLEIRLVASASAPVDIDIRVSDPNGVLASSNTPKADETLLLGGPEFKAYAGKDLTLEVALCAGQATYEATIRQA